VTGIEITAVESGRDVHVLGYFFDAASDSLALFLERQRADRRRRVAAIAARLEDLGHPIDPGPLLAEADSGPGRSIGRPQVADALVAAGHARDRDDAFDRLLGDDCPAYVARTGATPEEVVELVAGAGGIASLAHPGLLRNDPLIARLAGGGLAALEAIHSDHDAATARHYQELARALGLAISGGSDFHGDSVHRAATLGGVSLPAADFARLEARLR
jgi:predicted metal-dependent phosphoesterase TrpH